MSPACQGSHVGLTVCTWGSWPWPGLQAADSTSDIVPEPSPPGGLWVDWKHPCAGVNKCLTIYRIPPFSSNGQDVRIKAESYTDLEKSQNKFCQPKVMFNYLPICLSANISTTLHMTGGGAEGSVISSQNREQDSGRRSCVQFFLRSCFMVWISPNPISYRGRPPAQLPGWPKILHQQLLACQAAVKALSSPTTTKLFLPFSPEPKETQQTNQNLNKWGSQSLLEHSKINVIISIFVLSAISLLIWN